MHEIKQKEVKKGREPIQYALAWTVCLWLVAGVAASQTTTSDSNDAAGAAFAAQDWETAARLLGKRAGKSGALSGEQWFRLGYSRYQLSQNQDALDAYAKAKAAGFSSPRLLGTEAILLARLGRRQETLSALEGAIEAGLPFGVLNSDPAFEPLRGTERFDALLSAARARTFPCEEQPESRQFDFWLGSWNVSAGGQQVGVNHITNRHNGCLVFEDYTAGAFSGQSFNFYDPAIGKWRQIWVDNRGTVTHYEGQLEGKNMVFEGTSHGRGTSGASRVRMTFEPLEGGDVRQHIESFTEETSDWTTSFDGLYERTADG